MQAWKAIHKNDRLDVPRNLNEKHFYFYHCLKKCFYFYLIKAIKMGVG